MEGVTIINSVERRSGKTTKTVDLAVQRLFEIGMIFIPSQVAIERLRVEKFRGRNLGAIIVDPDWEEGPSVQNRLFDLIMNRLKTEHYMVKIKRNDRVLFIDKEKYVSNGIQKS